MDPNVSNNVFSSPPACLPNLNFFNDFSSSPKVGVVDEDKKKIVKD